MRNKKKIDDVHSKYSGLLALLSGEPISASSKTSNPFCFRGLRPLDPQRGAALCPVPPAPSAAYSLQSFPWMVQEIEATPPGQKAYDNNSGTVTAC